MAEIGTGATKYKKFIKAMRAAFNPAVPFAATFGNTSFNYIVQAGLVPNLYLTSITINGVTRVLSAAELAYSAAAIGNLTQVAFSNALGVNFCAPGAWSAATKKAFDTVLLCTVEAARSKYIYEKVNQMLTGSTIDGNHIKEVAQMYDHSLTACGLRQFKPLDKVDYHGHYMNQKQRGNVSLAVFQTMGL